MTSQEPIRLSSFRKQSARRGTSAVDRQLRLSFGLAAVLFAASLTVGVTTLATSGGASSTVIHSVAKIGAPARG